MLKPHLLPFSLCHVLMFPSCRFAGPLCSQCGPGQICPGFSKGLPASCPANSVAAAIPAEGSAQILTASDCLCKPGYGRIGGWWVMG